MFLFLEKIIKFFKDNQIQYMLSGSLAMSIYVLPRATRDIDIVVHLQHKDVEAIVKHFSGAYYCNEDSVKEAIEMGGMFNIIDFASGFKADFIILKNKPYRQMEFSRRQKVMFWDTELFVASPEDLLISKLIWIQELQSAIQMEDIKNLSYITTLDWAYINYWVSNLHLNTFNLLIP